MSWLRAGLALLLAGATLAACGSEDDEGGGGPAPIPPIEAEGELGRLAEKANEILDGGLPAYERQLERLQGRPVVVNQWASWCGPCRFEFPIFKRLAQRFAGRVQFIGVNSEDSRDAAETFLRGEPTPYPHFFDPDAEIARSFEGGRAWPTTAFYDSEGELAFTHQGVYADEEQLVADIREHALGEGS